MKRCPLLILLLCFLPLVSTAQVKLKSSGKVIMGEEGTLWNSDTAATVSVYGTGTGNYPKISFGQLTKDANNGYVGPFIGEKAGNQYTGSRLLINCGKGLYITEDGTPESAAVGGNALLYWDPNVPTGRMHIFKSTDFYGQVYSYGSLLTSDGRLKTDIKGIESPLSRLQQLRGVNYRLLEKPKESQSEGVEKINSMLPDRERSGFVAQELEEIFPNLVETDAEGYKSVDYIGLIPVIVEALKEQQALINAQSMKITELQSAQEEAVLMPESPAQSRMAATQPESRLAVEEVTAINAFLYQNAPNPFNVRTEIRYYLPQEIVTATLYVFNMQGALVKSFPLTGRGESTQTVEASELAPGMYIYSLVADNREVDAKRMIVTE